MPSSPIKSIEGQAVGESDAAIKAERASDHKPSESLADSLADSSAVADASLSASQGQAALAALEALTKGAATAPAAVPLPQQLTEEMRRLLDWHWAQLEYGCSAPLNKVLSNLDIRNTL